MAQQSQQWPHERDATEPKVGSSNLSGRVREEHARYSSIAVGEWLYLHLRPNANDGRPHIDQRLPGEVARPIGQPVSFEGPAPGTLCRVNNLAHGVDAHARGGGSERSGGRRALVLLAGLALAAGMLASPPASSAASVAAVAHVRVRRPGVYRVAITVSNRAATRSRIRIAIGARGIRIRRTLTAGFMGHARLVLRIPISVRSITVRALGQRSRPILVVVIHRLGPLPKRRSSAPTATVTLSSATPDTDATVTATVVAGDRGGAPISLSFAWSVNGTVIQSATTNSLTDAYDLSLPGHGDYGDTVTVTVVPTAGGLTGMAARASALVTAPAAGTVLEYPVSATIPSGLAAGPDGNLWFSTEQSHYLGRITPSGAPTLLPLPTSGNLGGITTGPDANVWFTNFTGNAIGRITVAGAVTEFPVPTPGAGLAGIVTGSDGNLWFAETTGDKIGRITPTGTITEFRVPTASAFPHGLSKGPDGNIWFAEIMGNKIAKITPAGTITEFALPNAGSQPQVVTAGPDGAMWFTEAAGRIGRITVGGAITQFSLSSSSASPVGITAGQDGNVWFTEKAADKIARITPAGVITEFPVPTPAASPDKIIAGPDGNLWFTEHNADKIGRITP
jgi:streptogramin lyase